MRTILHVGDQVVAEVAALRFGRTFHQAREVVGDLLAPPAIGRHTIVSIMPCAIAGRRQKIAQSSRVALVPRSASSLGRAPSTDKGEAAGEAGWVGAPITMEKRALVGSANGAKEREVLIDPM